LPKDQFSDKKYLSCDNVEIIRQMSGSQTEQLNIVKTASLAAMNYRPFGRQYITTLAAEAAAAAGRHANLTTPAVWQCADLETAFFTVYMVQF
jgi:hypothetical protein